MTKVTDRSTKMIPPITPPMTGPAATELDLPTVEAYNTITCIHIQTYSSGKTHCTHTYYLLLLLGVVQYL